GKRARPVARPASKTTTSKTEGWSLRGSTWFSWCDRLAHLRLAARRGHHLPEAIHHSDVDPNPVLLLVQAELGDDAPFLAGHVTGGQPVEGIDQHVGLTSLAAAKVRKVAAE